MDGVVALKSKMLSGTLETTPNLMKSFTIGLEKTRA